MFKLIRNNNYKFKRNIKLNNPCCFYDMTVRLTDKIPNMRAVIYYKSTNILRAFDDS